MIRRLLFLAGGTLAVWVLVSLPLRTLHPDLDRAYALIGYFGTGLLLCLLPTAITLVWAGWALRRPPEEQMMAVLAGTGIRLFSVLAAGWALNQLVPFYADTAFLFWLVPAYLTTLALEIGLLLASRRPAPNTTGSPQTGQE